MSISSYSAPIEFEFYNEDQEPNLLLTQEPGGQRMTLELRNTSQEQIAYDETDNHHFELTFRPGTLINPEQIEVESTAYNLVSTPVFNGDGTLSVLIRANEERLWTENEHIQISGLKVEAGIGTRSTRMLLRYQHLKHGAGDFSGHQETQLHIVNSIGRINTPLQVGFVGDNHVLNDGQHENELTIRVSNPLRFQQTIPGNENSKLVLETQSGDLSEEWALGTTSQLSNLHITSSQSGVEVTRIDTSYFIEFKSIESGAYFDLVISNIITGHPTGHTNLTLHYENIPGYRDGQFVLEVEKSPLVIREQRLGLGTASPAAKLHIIDEPGEPGQGTLILGPTGSNSNLRMGYHAGYSWIQSHGRKPLAINPIGSHNNVGIGTNSPSAKLSVHPDPNKEGITIKSKTAGNSHLPHSNNWNYLAGQGVRFSYFDDAGHDEKVRIDLRTGKVGIGTESPDAYLTIKDDGSQSGIHIDSDNFGHCYFPYQNGWNFISGKGIKFGKFKGPFSEQFDGFNSLHVETMNIDFENGSVGIGTRRTEGTLHVANVQGDCKLILEADYFNTNESHNPHLIFRQDGRQDQSAVYIESNRLTLANSVPVNGGIVFKTGNAYPYTNATEKVRIATNGYVGIGTSSPKQNLHIAHKGGHQSGIRIDGIGMYWEIEVNSADTNRNDQDLSFRVGGSTVCWMEPTGRQRLSSDKRLKKDIEPMGPVLEKVCTLTPSRYRWNEDKADKEKDMGFIAQEVEELFPHLVKEREGLKNISYTDFGVLAIAAIKEQQIEIDDLKKEVAEIGSLKRELVEQRKMIEQLIKSQTNN